MNDHQQFLLDNLSALKLKKATHVQIPAQTYRTNIKYKVEGRNAKASHKEKLVVWERSITYKEA